MKKSTKNLIIIAAIALAVLIAFPLAACGSAEDFLPNLVQINADGGSGSGVITATDDGLICLTNYHVVKGGGIKAVTQGEITDDVQLLGYSDYHDIAVLKIRAEAPDGLKKIRTAEAKEGKTSAIGNAGGRGMIVTEGECTDGDSVLQTARLSSDGTKFVPTVATTAEISEGMSGGALMSGDKLIGIAAYGGQNANYAVPIGIALSVQAAALRGDVDADGRVILVGDSAYGAAYNADGYIGLMVSQTSFSPKPYGFIGVFENGADGEGMRVTRTGDNCPISAGDLVTGIGGVRIKTDNRNAVFTELYKYSTLGAGKPLAFTLSDGSKKEISDMKLKT